MSEDNSLYGKNKNGRIALCESCVYDGYCKARVKYFHQLTNEKLLLLL